MVIIECEQGTSLWWEAKRGLPSASGASHLLTPKTMKPSTQQLDYACALIADRLLLGPAEWIRDDYQSPAMEYGKVTEREARTWYEFQHNCDVREVGLAVSDCGRFCCSPDGLIGEDGGLELKCPSLKTQVRYLIDGTLPDEYKGQVHFSMIVTKRPWWSFVSYARGLPPLVLKVTPDEFTVKLAEEMEKFWTLYQGLWERIAGAHDPVPTARTPVEPYF